MGPQELRDRIEKGDRLTVLFYADWCGFSARFMQPFQERSEELPGEVVAANISADSDPRWDTYDIDLVPSLIVFDDGRAVQRRDGRPMQGLTRQDLDALIDGAG